MLRELSRRQIILLVVGVLALAGVLLFPLTQPSGFQMRTLTLLFLLIISAQGWNLIGGYTGYAAFGNVAFFGLGAYTVGILMFRFKWPFAIALVLAGVVAALFAVVIGLPLLRLRGHYFAIATLGVAEATREVVAAWTPVTCGAAGISLPFFEPRSMGSNFFYYLSLLLVLLGLLLTWLLVRSKLGYSWHAIHADEDGAHMLGINTTRSKVLAFMLAGILTGLAGGIYAYFNTFIAPEEVFKIDRTLQAILVTVLGGPGTLFGPIIGAAIYQLVNSYLIFGKPFGIDLGQFHVTLLGTFIVLVIIFMPQGIGEFLTGKRRLTPSALLDNVRRYRV
jgi:branched-chain amino acid transport system permease protein